jgi:phospholipase/lecithinase/hemolysin
LIIFCCTNFACYSPSAPVTLPQEEEDMNSTSMMRSAAARLVGSVLALLLPCLSTFASPYTAVVVYGDSLSDNGNFYAATGIPGAPYYNGRRSDGPVAVEQLASSLGAPLVDFAWIGATTGVGNYGDGGTVTSLGAYGLPGMTSVFDATKGLLAPYAAGGLFVVWGGPNDVLAPSPLDIGVGGVDWGAVITRAVGNEMAIVSGLQALGAQHILVPGMPDLGLTPYFQSIGQAAFGSAFTDAFNAALEAALPSDVIYFDTDALLRSVYDNPADYGLTDVTAPCYDGTNVCADPSQYLYFDDFHPTTAADAILARGFAAAVPEPGTLALVTITLFGLGASGRRQLSKRSAC